ncbi:hypothetical protein F3Y22_tig00110387pilonHSYRG00984 [Hibiscus syriacus]|uniref:non-specific serine/threonine protein kinase n=1 Tax=Hibiscus syriacus TaxID=106335 RepID=A0A6A3ARE5_HIBSY|nr:hypothetical protein F3Y22_tig00110387pilonHSYRG00984 [Hibiscus syriacus]
MHNSKQRSNFPIPEFFFFFQYKSGSGCCDTPQWQLKRTESCGSRAVDSLAHESSTAKAKLDVYNEVLKRIQESNYEEANLPGFDDRLWLHFNRLPARYALDVNVERAEDFLHKRLLHLAEDPANGPVLEVRVVQVYPVSTTPSVDSVHSDSSVKKMHKVLIIQIDWATEDKDSAVNSSPCLRPMHEITFSTVDRPKLLSQVVGASTSPVLMIPSTLTSLLAEIGLNIQEAHAFSTVDGYSLDVFVDGWPFEETEGLKDALEKEILKSKVPSYPTKSSKSAMTGLVEEGVFSLPNCLEIPTDGTDVWEIDSRQLKIENKIASGSYGDLYRGTYYSQEVAIKVLKPERVTGELLREFSQEVFIMRKIRHKNVVQFIGACTRASNPCIVTEFMARGSLYDYLHKHRGVFKLPSLLKVALDVSKGMNYLHQNNIIHRDLKTANLLMDENQVVKVADFGVARVQAHSGVMTAETGTYRWMAPELPYSLLTPLQAAVGVVQKNLRPTIPKNTHPRLGELLERCWRQDPTQRPNFSEIVQILQQIDKEFADKGDDCNVSKSSSCVFPSMLRGHHQLQYKQCSWLVETEGDTAGKIGSHSLYLLSGWRAQTLTYEAEMLGKSLASLIIGCWLRFPLSDSLSHSREGGGFKGRSYAVRAIFVLVYFYFFLPNNACQTRERGRMIFIYPSPPICWFEAFTTRLDQFQRVVLPNLFRLSSVEIEFDDEVRALILLSSLPDSWNATVTTVSNSSGNNKLKFDYIRDLVLSEEIRQRESGEASTSSALHTKFRGRTSERNSNRGRSKSIRGKSRTRKKDFTCYNCGKKCHFKRDCRALKKNTSAQESANVTEETGDAMILSVNSSIESWILDSGESFHSTPCQEIMENYVSGDFGKVHLVDDETLKIFGKGDIRLKLPNQTTWTLKGVRHIPGLKRNLISVGQIDGECYSTTFSSCECKITRGALVIACGKKTDTLYVTSNLENIIAAVDADGKSNLWHQRLGHMSEKGIKTFLSKGKLPDLENVDVGLCEDCIFGKQKKEPSPVSSLAGSLFYVTFIDDSTRKVWVYFLKKKSEVFDTFRKWKAMVENETGLKVKRLRSMRIHVGLPKFLWVEAINTAAYLINRGPSVPLDGRIPEEVWSKKEINLSHLRVFGCISYVHIDSPERSKLDAKSNKCAFVGYGGDEFDYRFWDYENRKIIRSRDVIFNKNMMYKDRSTVESSSSNVEAETKEFAEFEEISGNDIQINPEAVQEEPNTPELRCSSIIPKPTQWYSHSLHYLLLTENGELECYDEAIQVENSIKWESSMKDEIRQESIPQQVDLQDQTAENLHLEQLYIKTTFLYGDLEEEIYMRQPEGFIEAGKKNLDLGVTKQILGMRIKRDTKSRTLMLSQAEYINKVLSSKYTFRPDISHAVGAVSRYMNNPRKVHWEAFKLILRYLQGTTNKALCFKGEDIILTGYVDVDLAGNVDIRMSTTGYVYTLGGTAVSWVSQLQKIVALSTTEAEYVTVTEASKEMVWLQSFLEELGKKQENNVLYCDNQSVIHLEKNLSFHSRTKHIQLRYHFIRSLLENGILKLEKISGAQNLADMLTKMVTTDKLKLCSTSVGMLE